MFNHTILNTIFGDILVNMTAGWLATLIFALLRSDKTIRGRFYTIGLNGFLVVASITLAYKFYTSP